MSAVEDSLLDLVRQVVAEVLSNKALIPSRNRLTSSTRNEPRLDQAVFTAKDVGRLLGLSTKAVFARAQRGQFPGVFHLGRSLRFRGPAIRALLTEVAAEKASTSNS